MNLGSPLSAEMIREPAVAGRFYPGDAQKLKKSILLFMGEAAGPVHQKPVAVIAPHAGYVYSGQIAADAYRQATDYHFDLVVLLGAPHTVPGFNGISIYSGNGYRTPLGVAPIDGKTAAALIDADPQFAFKPEAHRKEHSIEVHIPFIQALFPKAKIVTALVGTNDLKLVSRFGKALAGIVRDKNALIIYRQYRSFPLSPVQGRRCRRRQIPGGLPQYVAGDHRSNSSRI